jgi:hypothetical protein
MIVVKLKGLPEPDDFSPMIYLSPERLILLANDVPRRSNKRTPHQHTVLSADIEILARGVNQIVESNEFTKLINKSAPPPGLVEGWPFSKFN